MMQNAGQIAAETSQTPMEKQTVRGYELVEVLGEGGFGTVYRAVQPLVKREVAIKVILSAFANQPEFVRRFETEAQVIAQLEHPHIIPLFDFWRDPTGGYLVMRFLRGGNVEGSLAKNGPWKLPDVLRLLDQICSALNLAHQNGIIHGDIKPANILLDNAGNGYLSDFGIASNFKTQNTDAESATTGTPAYIAPEQIQKGELSPATDVYSLALMFFEILTGKRAFQADTFSAYILKHLTESIPNINTYLPELPSGVNAVFQVATSKHPGQRYQSTLAFAQAFHEALEQREKEVVLTDTQIDDLISVPADLGTFVLTEELLDIEVATEIANPYKGLRAFQQGDAKDFFGRAALTNELIKRMNEPGGHFRFLAVVGPSGSGKSSAVKAGLLPALKRGAVPGSEHYFIAEMMPGNDVMRELENALLSVAIEPPKDLQDRLRKTASGLHEIVKEILPDATSEFLLLVDQFEEIFTLTPDNAIRTHFMDIVQYAITAPDSRLRVIITIRADFYDKPLLYPEFGALVRERTEIVLPLNKKELEEAIVGPAERVGVRVEPQLIRTIVSEVSEEPGALPLLQYALTENFERRTGRLMTLESYQASGGVLGSLARRAEELYTQMNAEQQEAVRQLFLRLVTLGEGTEDTRRRIPWSELVFTRPSDDPLQYVLDTYVKYRLLTIDKDPHTREPTVEVAHEALIRQWQRLRQWLQNSRGDLRTQRRLATALQEWRNSNKEDSFLATGVRLQQLELLANNTDIALTQEERDYITASVTKREAQHMAEEKRKARELALERRNAQIFRVLVAVFAVAAVVALGLATYAFTLRAQAERKVDETFSLNLAQQARQASRDSKRTSSDAIALAMEAVRIDNPPAFVQNTLTNLVWTPGIIRHYRGTGGQVFKVCFTADGKQMLTSDFFGGVILWDVTTGQLIKRFGVDGKGHNDQINALAISPDGKTAVSGARTKQLILWDMATGNQIRAINGDSKESKGNIWSISYTPDSRYIIVSSNDSDSNVNLVKWDTQTGNLVQRYVGHTAAVYSSSLSPDGKILASGDGASPSHVILWNAETGEVLQAINETQKRIFGLLFTRDGKLLIGGDDPTIVVWDIAQQKKVGTIAAEPGATLRSMALSPTGETFAGAFIRSGKVVVWDAQTYRRIREFTHKPQANVWGVTYTPDGQNVVSSDDDDIIRWDFYGRSAERARFTVGATVGTQPTTLAVNVNVTGTLMYANGQLGLWDTTSGKLLLEFTADKPLGLVYAAVFSADGKRAVTAQADSSVILWDVATGKPLRTYGGHNAPVRAVAISPDGKIIAGAGGNVQVDGATRQADNDILLWDSESGKITARLTGHTAPVYSLAFSPDGLMLASGSADTSIRLWNVKTAAQTAKLGPDDPATKDSEGHSDSVLSVAFSPDGKSLVSGGRDRRVIIWNAQTGAFQKVLVSHLASVRSVTFSPDGRYILSASGDLTTDRTSDYSLILWNVADGALLRQYRGPTAPIRQAVFAPDGKSALSVSDDGLLIVWRVDSLQAFVDWVYSTYEVDCISNPENTFSDRLGANTRCEPPSAAKSQISKPAIPTQMAPSANAGTPTALPVTATPVAAATPAPGATPITAKAQCSVANPADYTLSTAPLDMTAFRKPGPYTIGYSDSGDKRNLFDAYIISWARFEASIHSEIKSLVVTDAKNDYKQQILDIQQHIDNKVDLLLINPVEQPDMSAMVSAIQTAMQANIPVLLVNHRIPAADKVMSVPFVGPDDFKVGCVLAQEMITTLDGEGIVYQFLGIDSTASDKARRAGTDVIFNLYPTSMIRFANRASNLSESVIRTALALDPTTTRIDGVLGYDGWITVIAEDQLTKQGLPVVPAVGDQYAGLAKFTAKYKFRTAQVHIPANMGATAIRTALLILNGQAVPWFTEAPIEVIPAQSLDQYDLKNIPENDMLGDALGLPESFRPENPLTP